MRTVERGGSGSPPPGARRGAALVIGVRSEPLLTPAEVADLFRVDVRTVRRWEKAGWLGSVRTPGGARRYYAREVHALRQAGTTAPAASGELAARAPEGGKA